MDLLPSFLVLLLKRTSDPQLGQKIGFMAMFLNVVGFSARIKTIEPFGDSWYNNGESDGLSFKPVGS
jgi:hypothetical protein